MRYLGGIGVAVFGVLGLVASALGQSGVQWHPDFEGAKAVAAQRGQLVLAYFWAPWCPVCLQMEREVFSQPALMASIHSGYVPVKVNHDDAPQLIRSYGVRALPATVLISPDGRPLDRIDGRMSARQLSARLQKVASQAQRPPAGRPPVGPPPVVASKGLPGPGAPAASQTPPAVVGAPAVSGPALSGGSAVNNGPASGTVPPPAVGVARTPPVQQNPPLALEGYCVVSLTDDLAAGQRRWVLGNRAYGVIHRGRTYLFADEEKAARFFQEPDRYAPVLSGQDVVAAVDEGRTASGRREHGAFFGSRVYLFSSEETLQRFENNPNRYADAIVRLSSRRGPSW